MRLKELREWKGLTQNEVANAVGGTQSNLAKWEKEKVQPAADMIIKLADFFEVSTDYLLGREDDFGNITMQSSASSPIGEKLTDNERTLLNWFRGLPSEKARAAFLSFIRSSGEMFVTKSN